MKLCVALDMSSSKKNLELVRQINEVKTGKEVWLKIGFRTFIRDGKKFIKEIKKINPNFKIFLDLKLYDIPNTMADAAYEISKMNIDMFNIHASCGIKAMNEVMNRINQLEKRPLILGVTALTSFSKESFKNIYNQDMDEAIAQFSVNCFLSKMDGVVCSAHESKMIKSKTSANFATLCPGIRLNDDVSDDQNRVATIELAKENAVDFAVIGRPIYNSANPKEIVKNILNII